MIDTFIEFLILILKKQSQHDPQHFFPVQIWLDNRSGSADFALKKLMKDTKIDISMSNLVK